MRRAVLKLTLRKEDAKVWTGFNWKWIRSESGVLWAW
jgi:hypothetical protein